MKVELILQPDEAAAAVAALGFVRQNLTLNPDNCQWRFIGGGRYQCDTRQLMAIGYVAAALDQARDEWANSHPFNPYISTH